MTVHRPLPFLVFALLALAGCIERKETITVGADGAVNVVVEHHTESHSEMYLGDAVPTLEGGWLVEAWTDIDDEGETHFHLKAEAGFPPGAELPSSYAAPTDPAPELSLKFPTTLTIEPRGDDTYYHFRRVYQSRPWAYVQALRDRIEHALDEIKDKDWKAQTPEERRAFLDGMILYEKQKQATFARAAFDDVLPEAPQDAWLAVQGSIMAVPVDVPRILELMGDGDDTDDEALEEIGAAFEAGMRESVSRAMRAGGFGGGKIDEMLARFDYHLRDYEITEELADDEFEIIVVMPGLIVGHNGDEATANQVTWKFGGGSVRDRDHELLVTSVLRGG